jgi:hypothetical protein
MIKSAMSEQLQRVDQEIECGNERCRRQTGTKEPKDFREGRSHQNLK